MNHDRQSPVLRFSRPPHIKKRGARPPAINVSSVLAGIGQPLVLVLLFFFGLVFCLWQWREFVADRTAAEQALHTQSESLFRAVVGAIRSHRRLGAFFDQQIQTVLDELVESKDVLAAAILDQSGKRVLGSGPDISWSRSRGGILTPEGYLLAERFELPALPPAGPGAGMGRGYGWGRWMEALHPDSAASPFAKGGLFSVVLLLDRTEYDAHLRRALANRLLIVTTGLCSLALMGVAWRLGLQAIQANHHRRLAEILAQHYEELGQAASGLAHETRNPLSLIRGWAHKIAHSQTSDPSITREAHLIMEECDRIAARLTQFLNFAKPCRPKLQAVDPDALIAELMTLLEPDYRAKHIRCEHQRAPIPATILADPDLLRQALFNLLHNAAKFSPEHTAIQVRTFVDGTDCKIEVADEGPGVPAENVPRLFTPYFTTDPQGTGLGLALVRRVAEAHGGTVQYEPRTPRGAIFRLVIPCYKETKKGPDAT